MVLMRGREVVASAPATVANLDPGFDVLGLALSGPSDTVRARLTEGDGVSITQITGDIGELATSTKENTAVVAARATLERAGIKTGIELKLH